MLIARPIPDGRGLPDETLQHIKEAYFGVSFESVQGLWVMLLEEGGLQLHFRFQNLATSARKLGKAAAVDNGKVFTDKVAILVRRKGDDLEAQLFGDKEYRIEDMVTGGLAEGVIGHDNAVVIFSMRNADAFL